MRFLSKLFASSPVAARGAPFVIFAALTFGQGQLGEASRYWIYLGKTLAGIWLIWEMRPYVAEIRWAFSWEAVVVGIGVFALWVGITGSWTTQDTLWPKFVWFHNLLVKIRLASNAPAAPATLWNPLAQFGQNSGLAWLFIVTRVLGSTLVVPPLEEAFYRSFLYRYIANQNFLSVSLNRFLPGPFVATALVFGLSHNEWISGILCGAAYQWLVIRKNRLGDAMTAHAITNFLLGLWVVSRGAWNFW
jgi:membrane protease YdiL (CAAX protease family)